MLILIFAAALSAGLQEWVDAAIVLSIVLGASLLSFFQEYRASRAVDELKQRLALTCRVVRDGAEQRVLVSAVVPGDVILLSAGNLIPADGLVVQAQDFLVSQAAMTGESFPVEKRPGVAPADAQLAARTNTVFLGSSVRSGSAKILAVKTGRRTEFGAIAGRLRARPPETDFERGVRLFGYLLVRIMVLVVLFVLAVNLLIDRPPVETLLFAVALAVGLSPELLPGVISVTLSVGARAMARRGVIVRRLESIENLGGMNILCTDKTGTLTEGRVILTEATDADNRPSQDVLQLAYLNAAFETGIDNPLDVALTEAGERAALSTAGFWKVDEIPYDFERRRLTIVVADERYTQQRLLITKGAFSNVLGVCSSFDRDGEEVPLDDAHRMDLEEIFRSKGQEGFRVLALATRKVAWMERYSRSDETAMTFRGLLIFCDPPKTDAPKLIADLGRLGIRVKVISGDNRHVCGHLATAIGLDPNSMLTGDELAKLRDEALWRLAPHTDLFVEIDPQQKEMIVRALQRAGNSVGYLGDGINDAPALHAADVGISVEGAVEAARESADIILTRRDLDVLRSGVEDGRQTFANTLKYISITISANFGNMISMALAAPLLPFLPLSAKQILLNNFLSDIPSLAISTDRVEPERLAQPQRWSIQELRRFMVGFGLISSVFDLLTFAVLLVWFHANEAVFQTSWFVVSLLTELAVLLVLRTRESALRNRPSALLLWSTVAVAFAALATPFLGTPSALFGFTPISPLQIATLLAIVAGYVAATEAAKGWLLR